MTVGANADAVAWEGRAEASSDSTTAGRLRARFAQIAGLFKRLGVGRRGRVRPPFAEARHGLSLGPVRPIEALGQDQQILPALTLRGGLAEQKRGVQGRQGREFQRSVL